METYVTFTARQVNSFFSEGRSPGPRLPPFCGTETDFDLSQGKWDLKLSSNFLREVSQ